MAYPTVGTEGKWVSWAAAGVYNSLFTTLKASAITWTENNASQDTTGLDATTATEIPGLKSGQFSVRAFAFASPTTCYVSSLALSSGYATRVRSWEFIWETSAVIDVTDLGSAASPVEWMDFRPDFTRVSGSFECLVDSATALTDGTAAGGTPPTMTLVYAGPSGSATASLAGSAVLTQAPGASVSVGQANTARYNFKGTGNWAATGASSIFGALTLGAIPWSAGGTLLPLVMATLTGSKTITASDTFLRRLRLSCPAPGALVQVELDIQATGSVAYA
jgi:hypothetical protein